MQANAAAVIHEARVRAGLSQRALAERAATSQAVISAYENGRRDPTFDHLAAIVAATGHALTVSLGPTAPATAASLTAIDSDDEDDRILENLRLSPAERLRKMGAFRAFVAKHRGALARR